MGAAISALITQSLTTAGLITLGHLSLNQKPEVKPFLGILFYFIILIVSGWILESSGIFWMLEVGMFLFVSLVLAFLFKLLKWESVKQLFESYTMFRR